MPQSVTYQVIATVSRPEGDFIGYASMRYPSEAYATVLLCNLRGEDSFPGVRFDVVEIHGESTGIPVDQFTATFPNHFAYPSVVSFDQSHVPAGHVRMESWLTSDMAVVPVASLVPLNGWEA